MKIGVSACLLGQNVRFDGTNKLNKDVINIISGCKVIPICPEVFSGFNVPHDPIEIKENQVIDQLGNNYTKMVATGSEKALELVKECDFVILKSKSPTCGYKKIYDGSFTGNLVDGNGVFTKLCINNNIPVYSENEIEHIKEKISSLV